MADLAGDRLADAATHLGQSWLGVDCASEEGVAELVAFADQELGGIDLFVANAGVFGGFGLDAAEADWARSWEVNVMAQVRAARAVVPRWSMQNPGVFAVTASAAGLLTQLGSPTYSATKHASVGFATWLAATYGDQGVQVCALCPMGVETAMIHQTSPSADNDAILAHAAVTSAGEVLSAESVAHCLLEAIDDGRFLALPHESVAAASAYKASAPDKWLASMWSFRDSL